MVKQKGGQTPKFTRFLLFSTLISLFLSSSVFSFDWPYYLRFQKNGATANDNLGFSVADIGDIDGDGISDFVVGAPYTDSVGFLYAGSAYVYSGATGNLIYKKGNANNESFGFGVAGIGDADGDGIPDFIVGSRGSDDSWPQLNGSAYVYSGASGTLLFEKHGSGRFGYGVAGTGDVNGDGRADFIVGAWNADVGGITRAGSAFVYSGATGELFYQKNGSLTDDFFGISVAGAGDMDEDGKADFIIGASGFALTVNQPGSAYVYSGATGALIYQKNGFDPGDGFGRSVANAGDLDGDGTADFMVGAFLADPNGLIDAGSAYVYSGATGALLFRKNGSSSGDWFGLPVDNFGDINGDGKPDFVFGSPGRFGFLGTAYVYSGSNGTLLFQKNGFASNDQFGFWSAGVKHPTGNRGAYVLFGAQYADPNGLTDAGSVFVLAPRLIEISSISDIPNDQGKRVDLVWKTSPPNDTVVDFFVVLRSNDTTALSSATVAQNDFVPIDTVDATGDTLYSVIVNTLVDSTPVGGQRYSRFIVKEVPIDTSLYIASKVDSGFSVDNLAPSAPSFLAAVGTCQGNQLSYSNPVDPDFQYFKIYRDTTLTFSTPTLVGTTIDSFFVDAAPVGKPFSYLVKAVDFSGNESVQSPQADAIAGLKGDLNLDGILTGPDVVLVLNAAFLGSPFPASFCAADANCDLILTGPDVVLILNAAFLGTPITCTP